MDLPNATPGHSQPAEHARSVRPKLVERVTASDSERPIGIALVVVALLGAIAGLIGAAAGWRLVGNANRATVDTLDVTIDALDSVSATIEVADGTVTSTSEALTALETTLASLSDSLDSGADVVDDAGSLTATSGPALADAAVTFRQLETAGAQIDGFLAALAAVPLSPSFDPDSGLETTFGRLADDLEPLDESFAATTESLETFEGSLADLRADVDDLTATVGRVNADLDAGRALLDDYRANVAEAQALALASRTDLGRDQSSLRLAIVVAGFAFAGSQLAPLWLGLQLLTGSRRNDTTEATVSRSTGSPASTDDRIVDPAAQPLRVGPKG